MNKYQKQLNKISQLAFEQHCMATKERWYNNPLFVSPMYYNDPILLAYEDELYGYSYNYIRHLIKINFKTIEELESIEDMLSDTIETYGFRVFGDAWLDPWA